VIRRRCANAVEYLDLARKDAQPLRGFCLKSKVSGTLRRRLGANVVAPRTDAAWKGAAAEARLRRRLGIPANNKCLHVALSTPLSPSSSPRFYCQARLRCSLKAATGRASRA